MPLSSIKCFSFHKKVLTLQVLPGPIPFLLPSSSGLCNFLWFLAQSHHPSAFQKQPLLLFLFFLLLLQLELLETFCSL